MNKIIYFGFSVLGFILPYSQFVPYIIENGINVGLIINEIMSSQIATFGWLDVVISAIVLVFIILEEKERIRYWWLPIIATFTIGVSCGLPLYFYLKE